MTETLAAIAAGVDALRRARIVDDFSRLRTISEQLDEGWSLSDGHSQWRQVAGEAHVLTNTFERRAAELLSAPTSDPLSAEPFIEAVGIAGAARVAARLATGDDAAAKRAAYEAAQKMADLVSNVDTGEAALVRVRNSKSRPGSLEWGDVLADASSSVQATISALRDRQVSAAATALTLAELEAQGISGRDWIESARTEQNSPFICLLPRAQVE